MSTDDSVAATAETRHFGEFHQERAVREQEWRRRELVRRAVRHVNRHLAKGDYGEVAAICRDRLVPSLDVDTWGLRPYHERLEGSALAWDWEALNRFLEEPTAIEEQAQGDGETLATRQRAAAAGGRSAAAEAARVIHHAAKSLESIAVAQGHIKAELTQASRVLGYTLQLGRQWHGWEFDNDDEVRIVDPDLHPPFTMCIGDPGNGKSTAVESLAEDAYQDGKKIIDLVDFSELENAVYDIESADEDMQAIREQYGLPTSFGDREAIDRPDVQILHPLCETFCEAHLPYDTGREEFVARPFVIPVADLDYSVLKEILGDLTRSQETALNQALAQLDDGDDWSLHDLAQEVLLTQANEGVKRRLLTRLDTLNSHGFIATRSHEHAIEWDDIFRDTETITVFSCSMLSQTEQKLMAVAYLTRAIFHERMPDIPTDPGTTVTSGYPRMMMVAREFQKLAPSMRKMKGNTNTEQRLKSRLISQMQRISEERRHVDMGIIADTQQWVQVNKGVRENVDRLIMFKLGSGAAKGAFDDMTGDFHVRYANRVSNFDRGTACVFGSQWLSTGRDFEMPITWIPPLCHHLDAENEDEPDGWRARALFKDDEELRESPYGIETRSIMGDGSEKDDPAENTPDGFGDFADLFEVTDGDGDLIQKSEVYDAYCRFADEHDMEKRNPGWVGRWFRQYFPEDVVPEERGGGSDYYARIRWRPAADRYREVE